jgi:Cd2+/Zn2+-exporting ATPase
LNRTTVRVSGMDCASCALTLERSVAQLKGVDRAVVNFAAARMDVHHAPTVTLPEITRAVQRAGFEVPSTRSIGNVSIWSSTRARLTVLSTALFLVGLALAQIDSIPHEAAVAVLVAAILSGGMPIFRSALVALRARHLDMNVLMSAATIGAALIGEWPEAAAVVALFGIGNTLQVYAIERTRNAVQALAQLTPSTVLVRRGDSDETVAVDLVQIGDHVIVRPGERVAIDGSIVDGSTTVDESPVTGESAPVEKSHGDRVLSGSLNGAGSVVVAAERTSEQSTLQQIVRLVEDAQATKAPTEQFVDRFSRAYTPIVVAAAAALIAIPPMLGEDFTTWFYRGLALLIIACPCSLVISTPVTVVSGIGAASRRGILIKGGAALEAAGQLTALALDKTGTLTEGRPVLASTTALDNMSEDEALRLAGALERRSEHPLAHAILTAAAQLDLPTVEEFTAIPGRGAHGRVNGRSYLIGSPRLFTERNVDLGSISVELDRLEEAGETPVILGDDQQQVLAVFGLADAIRPEAADALAELRRSGMQYLVMLTGDSDGPARRIATELGIDYRAQLLPEQKVDVVRELLATHKHVGMVGDGINDAPALATASVSFAMGAAGSDVALESADIALMQDDLGKLAEAVRLSHTAERIIRQNIIASLVIKGAFVLLAPFGLVTLWVAVAADMGTSIAVTLNGLRLFRHSR